MEAASRRNQAIGETSTESGRAAVTVGASCQTCPPGAAAATAAGILVAGLFLVLFVVWTAAPQEDQMSKPSETELAERLQQCQTQRRGLSLMLHTVTQDSRCSLCPGGWLWWGGQCYFFSVKLEDNRRWNESAEFCKLHNSSLAVIKDSAEMEFLQGVMGTFPRLPFLWVGLTDSQQEGRWLWLDGMDVQHYLQVTVQWDADHRDCADLRGGGSLFAADCEEYGPWVCQRAS